MHRNTHIKILLCTYNGAQYLPAQLASYLQQTHTDWSLWVSDDGSCDQTLAIIRQFAADNPSHTVHLINGPRKGLAQNYLSLICRCRCDQGFIALSDQDDVWLPERLQKVVEFLRATPADEPAIYSCRTIRTDENLRQIHRPLSGIPQPAFCNALVQNILAGNTLALNPSAAGLVRQAGRISDLPFHDWWIYLLISGAGGSVIFDAEPRLLYRQHSQNFLGAHRGFGAFALRFVMIFERRYQQWVQANAAALAGVEHLLSSDNHLILQEFLQSNVGRGFRRARLLGRLGIRRQTRFGNFLLANLAFIGRV